MESKIIEIVEELGSVSGNTEFVIDIINGYQGIFIDAGGKPHSYSDIRIKAENLLEE